MSRRPISVLNSTGDQTAMGLPSVLATVANNPNDAAVVEINLNNGTFKVLLPYLAGGLCATTDQLLVASSLSTEHDRTRIEKYDREGLVWMSRVDHCIDPHSLVQFGDELAVCSTGT